MRIMFYITMFLLIVCIIGLFNAAVLADVFGFFVFLACFGIAAYAFYKELSKYLEETKTEKKEGDEEE